MKKLLLATSIVALSMGPALAQSSDSSSDMSKSDSTSMSSSDSSSMSSSDSSGNSSMSTEDMVASQSKVLDALKQAGYTDAEIMDAAYMVQAKTPDGEQVLMMIDTGMRGCRGYGLAVVADEQRLERRGPEIESERDGHDVFRMLNWFEETRASCRRSSLVCNPWA